jgi:alpha-glucosidase
MVGSEWWKRAVFYQIYPRSFADSNGDGIGDLPGIVQRLNYLQDLGVDAIWLSPHYPSPLWDHGYDVSDYLTVAPEYGHMDDFRRLVDGLHERGMHLITDFVLNHTSDRHSWFLESSSSVNNRKRDWYIWKDGENSGPPNNWYSWFGGPAWEYDPHTAQYYYHFFFKQQPDLNWRHPEVKTAMFDTMRYWLEAGVDGFRLDALGMIFEAEGFPDQQSGITQRFLYHLSRSAKGRAERALASRLSRQMFKHQMDLPEVHGLLRELRGVIDEFPRKVLVGETERIEYYGSANDELQLLFNFPLTRLKNLTPSAVLRNQRGRLSALPQGAWPSNTLGNHDTSRQLSRHGDGVHDPLISRMCLALMLTLPGTPFLYNGEEIGMADHLVGDILEIQDNIGQWAYRMEIDEMGRPPEKALDYALQVSRDKCRTPFQWARGSHGGFCPVDVVPWLTVNPNYAQGVNAAEQESIPDSTLKMYKALIKIRRQTPALIVGDFQPLSVGTGCLAFVRGGQGLKEPCLVVLNLGARTREVQVPADLQILRPIFGPVIRSGDQPHSLRLSPYDLLIAGIRQRRKIS